MVDESYAEHCRTVAAALPGAYRPYLEGVLTSRGFDPAPLAGAIGEGHRQLVAELAVWAERPALEQRATPMELFREALSAPTSALAGLGVAPIERDEPSQRTLPGDAYDLAPSSARDLDEAAWRAVAAWGIARAEEVGGVVPASTGDAGAPVVLVGSDLMDRSKVAAAAEAAGLELSVWRNPAAIEAGLAAGPPRLALIDLTHPAAVAAVTDLSAAGVTVIAFGPHVDTEALAAATAAGAVEALPRSRFFARLGELIGAR